MEFLEHVWYCSALSTEVTGTPFARTICDKPIVFYRGESGRAVALEDRCAHRQAPLSLGRVLGDDIECSYHGFLFDCSGACVHVPHQDTVPRSAAITAYPLVERWGYIWLWLGDPAQADPATVPHLPWTEDKRLRTVYFRFDVAANFQLMADNLMDVSHTDFLHRASIGSQTGRKGQNEQTRVELDCRIEDERVHFIRRVHNTLLGPIATKWAGSSKPVTRSNTLMWEAPNTIHSVLEFQNEETHHTIHMEHIMTPSTAAKTFYFMNWVRDFGTDNVSYPTDDDVRREQTAVVADEDVPMVEAQQRNIERFGMVHDIPARQDQFITAVHHTLRQIYAGRNKRAPAELERLAARHRVPQQAAE
jgi:vanillate O-demethylase monooxygenase subunit